MPLPALQTPPAVIAPAPSAQAGAQISAQEAEAALLEAFDYESPLPLDPKLKGAHALAYRWLRAAASFDPIRDLPANPFATGREKKEAESLQKLLRTPKEALGPALKTLPMRTSGTALALWRWGQLQVRMGAFDTALRRAWEDRLVTTGPVLTRGYGVRHALCWALAEQDEARFARVRALAGTTSEDTIKGFQRLFGLLGGTSPELRLWALPSLDYHDLRLDQLGATRIWICPAEKEGLPSLPAGTAWVIPSATADLSERDASLSEGLQAEAKALASRLQAAGRSAQLAPSRAAFENLSLVWFPILIELDGKGNLQSIRMGDAAPERP
jgi:hypothetical protein